jgi:hypothetical protein
LFTQAGRHFPFVALVALVSFPTHSARAQGTSGTYANLAVTGTASVNYLDIQGNSAIFGSWGGDPSEPGVSFAYSDGTGGTDALYTSILTRPGGAWDWLRLDASGSAWPVMELSSSNQLILTGTQTSNAGSIVIDPTSGEITINGWPVLTSGGSSGSIAGGGVTWDSSGDLTVSGSASFANGNDLISNMLPDGTIMNLDLEGVQQQSLSGYYGGFLRIQSGADPGNDVAFEAYADEELGAAGFQAYNRESGQFYTMRQIASDFVWGTYTDSGLAQTMTLDNNGNLGIGTTTPQATLDVNGSANFSGPVDIQPQGDLSMGQFTASPNGGGGGGGDDDAVGIGGGLRGGGGALRGGQGAPILSGSGQ